MSVSCRHLYLVSLSKFFFRKASRFVVAFFINLLFAVTLPVIFYIWKTPLDDFYIFLDHQKQEQFHFMGYAFTYNRQLWKETLYRGEKSWRHFIEENYFAKRPQHFPYLDSFFNALTPLKISEYRLGTEERLEWNRFITKNFSTTQFFTSQDGWYLLHTNRQADKENETKGILFTPAHYYFAQNSQTNIHPANGIYVNAASLSAASLQKQIAYCKRNDLNALVIDIKDVTGFLNYQSHEKDLQAIQNGVYAAIKDLKSCITFLHEQNIYIIARVSLFHDYQYGSKNFAAVLKHPDNSPYRTGKNTLWLDPSNKEVQDYNIKIIYEALRAGADEIQLDYIRYPAEKKWQDVIYPRVKSYHDKTSHLLGFLQRVHSLTKARGALLSIDVFGITIFQEKSDIYSTGQDLLYLSQASDILSPMIYPSHYADGFHGFAQPGAQPYGVVLLNLLRLKQLSLNSVEVRPWLQAFAWRAPNYSPLYIEEQVRAVLESGYSSFLFWNASTRYPNFSISKNKKISIKRYSQKSNS